MEIKKRHLVIVGAFIACIGCGSDDTGDKDTNTPPDSDSTHDTNDTGTSSEDGSDNTDTSTEGTGEFAINENFDNWDTDDVANRFYMAKPDAGSGTYMDNATKVNIAGHDCLALHETAAENGENAQYGYAIEAQFTLDQQTDMSGEDYVISFDVYIPQTSFDLMQTPAVQFAFYETTNYTPIYSVWYSTDNNYPPTLVADTWLTITAPIDNTSGLIDYSGFTATDTDNPALWIFDVVRIQFVTQSDTVTEGDEYLFYLDNLVVEKVGKVDNGTDAE